MAIRLICDAGTVVVQAGPTRDLVEIRSQVRDALRRILGPEAVIHMSGRTYLVRVPRDRLGGVLCDVFEKYGG